MCYRGGKLFHMILVTPFKRCANINVIHIFLGAGYSIWALCNLFPYKYTEGGYLKYFAADVAGGGGGAEYFQTFMLAPTGGVDNLFHEIKIQSV